MPTYVEGSELLPYLLQEIATATCNITMMQLSIDHSEIADALVKAAQKGIIVRIIVDKATCVGDEHGAGPNRDQILAMKKKVKRWMRDSIVCAELPVETCQDAYEDVTN